MVLSINTKFSQGFWAIQEDAFYALLGFISIKIQGILEFWAPNFTSDPKQDRIS